MPNFPYTAFVRLGSGDSDIISIQVSAELSQDEILRLSQIKDTYQGKPLHISREVQQQYSGLHRKLKKEAQNDVEYLLTQNAVDNGYSEVSEQDLFAQDCESGRFIFSDSEDETEAMNRWQQEQEKLLQSMSRSERTVYLAQRYIIELDFDENDYDYCF